MSSHTARPAWRGILALALAVSALSALLVSPARAATPTDLFFSEYIEGSGFSKALEVYNGTGASIDLAAGQYVIQMYFNGSTSAGLTINLGDAANDVVSNGDVFVIAPGLSSSPQPDPAIIAQADLITSSTSWFNGDDAVVLRKGGASGSIVDVIGQVGFDPGTRWGTSALGTLDNTIRRKATVCAGDTDPSNVFSPADEWDGFANNTFGGLGSHTANCGPTTPSVSISATDASAGEAGDDGSFRITRTGSLSAALSVSYSISGTASPGDYSPTLTGSAVILSGQSFVDITIDPVDDAVFEESESLTLTLVDGNDYNLGSPESATLSIADNDSPDAPPAIAGTIPADDATNVSVTTNITINFSEPVNVAAGQVTVECPTGTVLATNAAASNVTSLVIDPAASLPFNTLCTVTVPAGAVSDVDGNDPPDTLTATFYTGFTTAADPCTLSYTPISSIQGSGASAALTGNVSTQGVVVGDFDGPISSGLQGFYIQDPAGDGNPATSDGIFVFTGDATVVSAGQLVRVSGFARERFNQTTINGSNNNAAVVPAANIVVCGSGSVAPVDVTLPFASSSAPERYEGMLVRFPQALQITEFFDFDRFGEFVLGMPLPGEPRVFSPTALDEPGPASAARATANSVRRILVDDGRSVQNADPARHPNGSPFTLDNRFRGGDLVQNTVGVIGFDFSRYRLQPTGPADYTAVNQRPAAPEAVGGNLKVSAFNTLNYFLTPDAIPTDDNNNNTADDVCGGNVSLDCRGWDIDQPNELPRQRTKLLAAILGLNADVLGLNELENTPGVEPLQDIVDGLNAAAGAGTYAYINTGSFGTDAIKVGLIYKPGTVTPVGAFKLLTSSVDPRFNDGRNRPVLAQTFEENATGARFTVAVAHLKSKGSGCGAGDDDPSFGGPGNCNLTRTRAAEALVDWLASDPTGSGDSDFLIVGDLNSYAKEDPIDAILAGADGQLSTPDDFTNLIQQFQGTFAYSYVFDGQLGYLDHALASASMARQVTGATDWHINADESDLLDYDTSFKQPAQDAIYATDAYRTSDHDPLQVGVELNAAPTVAASFGPAAGCGVASTLSGAISDPNTNDSFTAVVDWGDGSAPESVTVTDRAFSASHTYARAGTYTATVTVADSFGESASATAETAVNFTVVGGGLLQPINQDGSSVFRYGSTIPVKLRLQDCDGSFPANLAPTIKLTQLSGSAPGSEINEPVSTGNGDSGNVLRYDAVSQQYIFNLATKSLPDPTAIYEITITVPATKQTVKATFGLR